MARLRLIRTPGKYVQGAGALASFYEEAKDFGKNFFFICSNSGYKACHELIEKSFAGKDVKYTFEIFTGISSNTEVERIRKMIQDKKADCVVGIGGGSSIDTAKACAYYEKLAVVSIPTVCSTDAPCTGISVIYNDDHTVDKYLFYPKNPDMVLVDSNIIANAPVRFLVSGMGDALGTYFEARTCMKVDAPSLEQGGVTRTAMALCELCYENLLEFGKKAKISNENHLVTTDLDIIIETNTYLSGVGADNAGLALVHSVYNGLTALDELKAMHGECVAFGTVVQLLFEGAPLDELEEVLQFCLDVGLPVTLAALGLSTDRERLMLAAKKACAPGETSHFMPGDIMPEQLTDLFLLADKVGEDFRNRK